MPGAAQRSGPGATALLVLLLSAGCDVPTEAPWWETRWVIPAENTRVGIGSFLPEQVVLDDEGTSFLVLLEALSEQRSLGELCPACLPFDGLTAPKPAFEGVMDGSRPFPEALEETAMEDGRVTLELRNEFSFDPIRPGPTPGRMDIRIVDGPNGRILADTVISGEADDFPAGSIKLVQMELDPGQVRDGLFLEVFLDSPPGDPAEIRTADLFRGDFTPDPIRASSALVEASGLHVTIETSELDVADLDPALVARILDGAVEIRVNNPYDLTVDMDLRISGPETAPIERDLEIVPGEELTRMEFTAAELQSFLGRAGVRLEGSGIVRGTSALAEVTPGQEITLVLTLDLMVRMGSRP